MPSQKGNLPAEEVALIGFASGCAGTVPGANEGPAVLRRMNVVKRLEKLGINVKDLGDATADITSEEEQQIIAQQSLAEKSIKNFAPTYLACKRAAEKTTEALHLGRFPLILGGDHSLSIGSVAAVSNYYAEQKQNIGLIWIDTHSDINTPATSPSHMAYGMSVAFLLGLVPGHLASLQKRSPAVKIENLVYIGLRDVDEGEKAIIREKGIHAFTISDIDMHGMGEICYRAHELASKETAGYVASFDLDVCDPQYVPGTGTPMRGGLTFRESHLLLEILAVEKKMLGFELVELNPRLDKDDTTAEVALSFVEAALGKTVL